MTDYTVYSSNYYVEALDYASAAQHSRITRFEKAS